MLISPKTIYQITESWKSNSINEPSPIYCMSIRVGGGAFFYHWYCESNFTSI